MAFHFIVGVAMAHPRVPRVQACLCRNAVAVAVTEGEFVYRQGQDSDGFYVVLEGTMQKWTDHNHGGHGRTPKLPVIVSQTADNGLEINRSYHALDEIIRDY
eukprot:scaffold653911_cov60-Prasinocladus_malaysianus.AAC.1